MPPASESREDVDIEAAAKRRCPHQELANGVRDSGQFLADDRCKRALGVDGVTRVRSRQLENEQWITVAFGISTRRIKTRVQCANELDGIVAREWRRRHVPQFLFSSQRCQRAGDRWIVIQLAGARGTCQQDRIVRIAGAGDVVKQSR